VTEINADCNPQQGSLEQADSRLPQASEDIKPAHMWLMAFSVGAVVANTYYIQPRLATNVVAFRILTNRNF
jgi:hypothetical protein